MEKTGRKPKQESEVDFLKQLSQEEQVTIERIRELITLLKTKHQLSTKNILQIFDDKEIFIPSSIFTKKLSVLETITKYLKEDLQLSYHRIGQLLNRNERNIWHTYNHTKKKFAAPLKITASKYFIPVSLFQNDLSVLENIVVYGKEHLQLTYRAIGQLLERNERTVWTMYQRALKKRGKR